MGFEEIHKDILECKSAILAKENERLITPTVKRRVIEKLLWIGSAFLALAALACFVLLNTNKDLEFSFGGIVEWAIEFGLILGAAISYSSNNKKAVNKVEADIAGEKNKLNVLIKQLKDALLYEYKAAKTIEEYDALSSHLALVEGELDQNPSAISKEEKISFTKTLSRIKSYQAFVGAELPLTYSMTYGEIIIPETVKKNIILHDIAAIDNIAEYVWRITLHDPFDMYSYRMILSQFIMPQSKTIPIDILCSLAYIETIEEKHSVSADYESVAELLKQTGHNYSGKTLKSIASIAAWCGNEMAEITALNQMVLNGESLSDCLQDRLQKLEQKNIGRSEVNGGSALPFVWRNYAPDQSGWNVPKWKSNYCICLR